MWDLPHSRRVHSSNGSAASNVRDCFSDALPVRRDGVSMERMLRLISRTRMMLRQFTWSIPSRLTLNDLVWKLNQCFDTAALNIQWIPETDGYYIHADYVFSLTGQPWNDQFLLQDHNRTHGVCLSTMVCTMPNYGPMVGEYPVDITNGLYRTYGLYCNIVKSKTIPLLANVPMDSLYKNYFYKNRMLVPCSELLDRIRVRTEGRKR